MSIAVRKPAALQPEPASGVAFDEIHFARQTFGDPDLQQEIIQLFLKQVDDARQALSRPMTTSAWRFLTHTLKGAAASVGAQRLSVLAASLELAGSPQDASVRTSVVARFEAEAEAFSAAVRGYHS